MTVSSGSITVTETPEVITRLNRYTCWERIVTFSLVEGDESGTAVVPINGVLQKIVVKLTDYASNPSVDTDMDVSLTDNGDNTIWSVQDLDKNDTYNYSVSEPIVNEVNVVLGFTTPDGDATVTVTLRGV